MTVTSLFTDMALLSKESICLQHRRHRFDPWVRRIPWRTEWLPTPVFLPAEYIMRNTGLEEAQTEIKIARTLGR